MINSCDIRPLRKHIWDSEPDSCAAVRLQLMDIGFTVLVNIIMLTDLAREELCRELEET